LNCLVYVDSSPRGDWALALAALLPGREHRSFHLLATSDDLEGHPDLLERAATRLPGARSIRTLARPGPPRNAVVLEARERPYDLVVVPPAGRNAVQRLFKGSRVATVVRSVRVPVLVARHPPARLDRILAAVSGGEPTGAVVAAAAELASDRGHVDYLHVASEVALPFRPHDAPAPSAASAPVVPDALHSAQEALARAGGTGSLVVREGIVVDEVLDAFESGHYDLLVVGASPEEDRGLGREDVTQRIVLRCSGSTLVVPASRLHPSTGAGQDRA
jgi:nucleotide-binding universal stress UspA family protein